MVIDASLEDAKFDMQIHWAIQLFFVIVLMLGLVVMNVYIGLLSNLYNEGKLNKHQIHQHLKAHFSFKLLLYKHWFPWLPFYRARRSLRGGERPEESSA